MKKTKRYKLCILNPKGKELSHIYRNVEIDVDGDIITDSPILGCNSKKITSLEGGNPLYITNLFEIVSRAEKVKIKATNK